MEITREVALVRAEESDQCTVTLSVGTAAIDLTPAEATSLADAIAGLARDAAEHEAEWLRDDIVRIASEVQHGFDIEEEDA